jgi:tRNA-binding protein
MNVYYNLNGIGDVLLVTLKPINKEERGSEEKGDVTRLYDKKTGEPTGYNIFKASSYFQFEGNGLLDITEDVANKVSDILTKNQIEENIDIDHRPLFIVGYVEAKEKHPNADKLSVCKVNIGDEVLNIVCGAPNVEKEQKVVAARVGAVMPSGMVIKEAELRGIESHGMICSAKELNLPDAPQEKGILVLSDEYQVGSDFFDHNNR